MAKKTWTTRTVARKRQPAKRWQVFETVFRNSRGQLRLFDRARVRLPGRSATRRAVTGTSFEYVGTPRTSRNPWRLKQR